MLCACIDMAKHMFYNNRYHLWKINKYVYFTYIKWFASFIVDFYYQMYFSFFVKETELLKLAAIYIYYFKLKIRQSHHNVGTSETFSVCLEILAFYELVYVMNIIRKAKPL